MLLFCLIFFNATACNANNSINKRSMIEMSSGITFSDQFTDSAIKESEPQIKLSEYNTAEINNEKKQLSKLELTSIDEWSSYNQNKIIYFTNDGCFYQTEIGGRDSANYILTFNNKIDNSKIPLEKTEDFSPYYFDGSTFYGYKRSMGLCSYEYSIDSLKSINHKLDIIDSSICYFTPDYIFFFKKDDNTSGIYKMDYNGKNLENVIDLDSNYDVYDFAVYDDRIFCQYINRTYDKASKNFSYNFSVYDLQAEQRTELSNGGIGLINNEYMYYVDTENDYKLMRFSLLNYNCEQVCECKMRHFDFFNDYILYSYGDSLYRMNETENAIIFSAGDYFNTGYIYEISSIQCQNNRIFINISSGPFFNCIMEIDIDGNVIEVIHED